MQRRRVPVHEKVPFFGELLFWLCLVGAAALEIVDGDLVVGVDEGKIHHDRLAHHLIERDLGRLLHHRSLCLERRA